MKALIIGIAAAAVVAANLALAQTSDESGAAGVPGGPRRAHGRMGGGPGPREEMVKKFDKDGDGKLSETELAEMRKAREARHQRMIKKFDKDGDGKLSETERAAMQQARAEQHQKMMKKFDTDGDGKLSETELAAMQKARAEQRDKILKEFDKDGDGQLSDAERAAMKEAAKGKAESEDIVDADEID